MKYVSVAEAKNLPGLRLVLTAHMPGPWGEAAKYVLQARNVKYTPVEQVVLAPNEDLVAWTGHRNAPTAMYENEPPQTTWIEILLLAERIGSGPSLIPTDQLDRAMMMGLCAEICGPGGLGWARRLNLMRPEVKVNSPPRAPTPFREQALKGYGVRQDEIAASSARLVAILNGLTEQLKRQKGSPYFVANQLTAADLHWAAFSCMMEPLPEDVCPMPDYMRHNYTSKSPEVAAALSPELIAHRDFMFERHIGLPLDF